MADRDALINALASAGLMRPDDLHNRLDTSPGLPSLPPSGDPQSNFSGIWPKPGAWKNLFGPEGEDFIRKMLTYGPAALGARTGPLPSRWESTYHGTADPAFALQNKPIWSGDQATAQFFAREGGGPGEPGAIAPLKVDTADYVNIRPNSLLGKIDDKVGSANELYNGGRNWLGDLLQLLGKRGVRYENLDRDLSPNVFLSLDPRTVRSGLDPQGANAKAPAAIPEFIQRRLDEDTK